MKLTIIILLLWGSVTWVFFLNYRRQSTECKALLKFNTSVRGSRNRLVVVGSGIRKRFVDRNLVMDGMDLGDSFKTLVAFRVNVGSKAGYLHFSLQILFCFFFLRILVPKTTKRFFLNVYHFLKPGPVRVRWERESAEAVDGSLRRGATVEEFRVDASQLTSMQIGHRLTPLTLRQRTQYRFQRSEGL